MVLISYCKYTNTGGIQKLKLEYKLNISMAEEMISFFNHSQLPALTHMIPVPV